jgi:hypothetical protein
LGQIICWGVISLSCIHLLLVKTWHLLAIPKEIERWFLAIVIVWSWVFIWGVVPVAFLAAKSHTEPSMIHLVHLPHQ